MSKDTPIDKTDAKAQSPTLNSRTFQDGWFRPPDGWIYNRIRQKPGLEISCMAVVMLSLSSCVALLLMLLVCFVPTNHIDTLSNGYSLFIRTCRLALGIFALAICLELLSFIWWLLLRVSRRTSRTEWFNFPIFVLYMDLLTCMHKLSDYRCGGPQNGVQRQPQ